MGKRLDQQPMYPQYTYYYPHYLQTKRVYGIPHFGPSGHTEGLEESVPDTEMPDRASLAGSVQIVFGAWCEAGVRCKE
ncbi:hypothetical protein DUI87_18412 [Hirundo rustica rustica]|uniref:Uncharacterized protein n=1 Tax=Hirundo rustica rustica TaxID=333673 RepID=A0A3M0JWU1_HIRRU|nr:hypothetical protein DUI87_18412 [Hirundo rustica rustica]